MCLQRKKVHGVLRGAVRSVSKRLAVHCIATPVLPLQRIFPQAMCPKQDRKLHSGLRQGQATRLSARHPAQRPATDWGQHTTAPDALKTGRCEQTFIDLNVLPTQYDREKKNRRLRQGQATRLSAHRPVQRATARKNVSFVKFFNRLSLTFHGGGAGGPSIVLSTARPYGHAALLLPLGDASTIHNPAKHKQWWRDSPTHLCGYATRMWIPPIRR